MIMLRSIQPSPSPRTALLPLPPPYPHLSSSLSLATSRYLTFSLLSVRTFSSHPTPTPSLANSYPHVDLLRPSHLFGRVELALDVHGRRHRHQHDLTVLLGRELLERQRRTTEFLRGREEEDDMKVVG